MKQAIIILFCALTIQLAAFSQNDSRPIVGVSKFSSEVETKYAGAITEKVIEMLTKSKRFRVADRTSIDKVKDELEFQKSEYFIDSKNTAEQGVLAAADFILTGHIRQINIQRILNADGSIGGYRASLSFTLKIDVTSTGVSTEAQSFESKGGLKALSPERAVDEAIRTLSDNLEQYFLNNFPLNSKIVKILTVKNDGATSVLIAGGRSFGLKEGDKLLVQKVEMLEGKPYPTDITQIKITKVVSDDFSECSVAKANADILQSFNAGQKLVCKLIKD